MIVYENNKVYRNLQEQVEKNKEDIETLKSGIKISRWLTEAQLPAYITKEHVGEYVIVQRGQDEHLYLISQRANDGLIALDMGVYPAVTQGPEGPMGPRGEEGIPGTMIDVCGTELKDPEGYDNGDMLLVISGQELGNLYRKVEGKWVLQSNIRGPQGPTGPSGTNVIANPVNDPQDTLNTVKIAGITYGLAGGISPDRTNTFTANQEFEEAGIDFKHNGSSVGGVNYDSTNNALEFGSESTGAVSLTSGAVSIKRPFTKINGTKGTLSAMFTNAGLVLPSELDSDGTRKFQTLGNKTAANHIGTIFVDNISDGTTTKTTSSILGGGGSASIYKHNIEYRPGLYQPGINLTIVTNKSAPFEDFGDIFRNEYQYPIVSISGYDERQGMPVFIIACIPSTSAFITYNLFGGGGLSHFDVSSLEPMPEGSSFVDTVTQL